MIVPLIALWALWWLGMKIIPAFQAHGQDDSQQQYSRSISLED